MENELISIVITTYKRADKIENAIKSVLNQTYKNLEIIIVDDNAKEPEERKRTKAIVEKYETIRYIENKENLGGALSRNVGIDNAKGSFIAFLDDDDKYTKNKIEKQYKCYLEHKNDNPGLIYCYCYRENINGEIIGNYKNDYEGKRIYENMLNCIAGTSLWFCPKKALIDVGKFEDTPCKQDTILLLKLLGNGYKVYRVPENLVYYYEHNGNGISGTKLKNIEGWKNYRKWSRKYYNQITKEQINNVEYNFSKQLLTLYIINNMKKEARNELKNMIKLKPLNKKTVIGIFKYLFPNEYLKILKKGKK